MNPTPESRVGEIATRYPLATRVFARHGIDFCCGGGIALADACAKRRLDTADVLEEIERTGGANRFFGGLSDMFGVSQEGDQQLGLQKVLHLD